MSVIVVDSAVTGALNANVKSAPVLVVLVVTDLGDLGGLWGEVGGDLVEAGEGAVVVGGVGLDGPDHYAF